MSTKKPVPITNWRTSDGRIHSSEDEAQRHENVIDLLGNLPPKIKHMGDQLYAPLMELNKHFHFVKVVKGEAPK